MWKEYDMVADECARRGIKGECGDELPNLIGIDVYKAINADPGAFQERVRMSAYAQAMNKHNLPEL
jgi:hypothetical protein